MIITYFTSPTEDVLAIKHMNGFVTTYLYDAVKRKQSNSNVIASMKIYINDNSHYVILSCMEGI
jgi:hypothetical protein